METQIIILCLLGIVYLITLVKLIMYSDDFKLKETLLYSLLNGATFVLIFAIAIVMIIELNSSKKQLKGKCPEYQMIDSVYILKR